jgi:hypothetical protein
VPCHFSAPVGKWYFCTLQAVRLAAEGFEARAVNMETKDRRRQRLLTCTVTPGTHSLTLQHDPFTLAVGGEIGQHGPLFLCLCDCVGEA